MIFASFEFVFLFLPVYFTIYFLAPARWRNWPVLILSWLFYAWWRVDFLALLIGVTVFTFTVARLMDAAGVETARGRRLFILGIAGNLGVLAYFKYADFGVRSFNDLAAILGAAPLSWTGILLPIGLSFYVLQSVSYLIDLRRGVVPVSRDFIAYATYKAIFSQLIAGPIVRYAEVEQDLKQRRHSLALFGAGARRFMTGFAMKVVLADTLSPMVDAVFALPEPTLAEAWAGAIAYTLQLFFDFAGYSAMAIGLALMCGFHFPENFDRPYLSRNIQEFWQRWHITLGRFLRDYLYIPLGGNRHGRFRTYLNLFLTMVIGGLWHGADWSFVLWGAWHGGMLALHRGWSRAGFRMPPALGHALLMLCIVIGWVTFRAPGIQGGFGMYGGMLGLNGTGLTDALAWQVTPDQWWTMLAAAVLVYLPALARHTPMFRPPEQNGPIWRAAWIAGPFLGFLLSLVLLYSRAAVPFLYFQF
ncbi:MBOAT family O-acyltransferase [Roseomonas marmotae]|uniref:Probable alginate O-acetylase AlgI n=1 Tax=Roseomonas marmotae TaxID=2768161 RepID=A0ABS3KG75_9PROT|nr:MBOAT family protein [Roseomonas marmotae]MBO1075920.1 MBOAT family protein [Roseomonas marmotae]QTI81897.1 MBOAT family protein [Roseomonas marmotae]